MPIETILHVIVTAVLSFAGGYLGVRLSVAKLEVQTTHHQEEISRLRVWVETYGGALPTRVAQLEASHEQMREWKHRVIDPIVPRAFEDHERRITRIEEKKG